MHDCLLWSQRYGAKTAVRVFDAAHMAVLAVMPVILCPTLLTCLCAGVRAACFPAVLDPAVAALQQHLGQCEARLRSGKDGRGLWCHPCSPKNDALAAAWPQRYQCCKWLLEALDLCMDVFDCISTAQHRVGYGHAVSACCRIWHGFHIDC